MFGGDNLLSIGTFSKISNVTAKTLRYYDEIGLIKPVHVNSENGYRYYDVEQLKTILLIKKLKQYCFSLDEILEALKNPFDNSSLFLIIKQKQRSIQEKLDNYKYVLSQLDKDISNLERGINIMSYLDNIQVKLVETQPKNILYIREKINIADFSKYMGRLFQTVTKEKLTIAGAPMSIYHDEEFNPESYDTEIAIPVKEVVKGTRELPGCLCAMATLKGPYSELTSIYAKLKQWIEAEGYTITAAPYEVYLTDPGQTAPEDYITEVYFPVKK